MFELLASFVQHNRRRVLLVAMVGVTAADVFGVWVAKRLGRYGATDPATESVQAQHGFKAAAARQIDPGVVAVVTATPREAA